VYLGFGKDKYTMLEDNKMIKIFAEDANKQILLDWEQTNSLPLPIVSTDEATALNITTFPCVVEYSGTTVTKIYADSLDSIMLLSPETMSEIASKLD